MGHITFLWDEVEDNVIEEFDEHGNTVVNYTTEPTLYGSVHSQDRNGQVRNYFFDGHANSTELTDQTGAVTDSRRYSAFGEMTASTGTTDFSWQFGGRHGYDSRPGISSTLLIRRRLYRPGSGHWISTDPIAPLECYRFVKNSPMAAIDPSGLHIAGSPVSPVSPSPVFVNAMTLDFGGLYLHDCGGSYWHRRFAVTLGSIADQNYEIIFVQQYDTKQQFVWCAHVCTGSCAPYDHGWCDYKMNEVFGTLRVKSGQPPATLFMPGRRGGDHWETPNREGERCGTCCSRGDVDTKAKVIALIYIDDFDEEIPGSGSKAPPVFVAVEAVECGMHSVNNGTKEFLRVNRTRFDVIPSSDGRLDAGESSLSFEWNCCPGRSIHGRASINGRPVPVTVDLS